MPEGPEVETERLHEAIHEEVERDGGSLVRQIALTTALFAAVAAIAALLAGSTVNEALVLKSEATTLQAQASDQWAYYQAKGVKAEVQDAITASFQSAGKPVPSAVHDAKVRYAREQEEIQKKALALEHQRDEKSAEGEELIHRHHSFANAVALLQVGIALGAVGALTRMRVAWIASVVLGTVGSVFLIAPFV
jgi:hypothetical protein